MNIFTLFCLESMFTLPHTVTSYSAVMITGRIQDFISFFFWGGGTLHGSATEYTFSHCSQDSLTKDFSFSASKAITLSTVSFICYLSIMFTACMLSKISRVNNSLHLWSEEISLVVEWISLDSNSSRVNIHYSASEISSGSLDIHFKRSDHWPCWRHYPRSENRVIV